MPKSPAKPAPVALLPAEREALVREYAARKGLFASVADDQAALRDAQQDAFLDELHPKQRAFAVSPSKRKVFRAGRRSGKTSVLLFITMQFQRRYPNSTIPYITLTREQARKNFWRPLKQLNARFRLGYEFNEQRLVATAPNGCEICLIGAADSDQIEKLRGDKYPLVMLDEVASFKAHLQELVLDVLDAALGDYDGTMILAGSPKESAGFFWEACTGVMPGWECHHANILDNSKFPQWAGKSDWEEYARKYLADKAEKFGADSPRFIREQLGEFYTDVDAQYFKFKPDRNTATALPPGDWLYALGVDFGASDPTAFVVLAVSPYHPEMYVVETFAKANMLDTEVAAKIRELADRYALFKRVADFAGKQFVLSLNARYSLGLVAAKKTERLDQIELLNSDFITGRIKILDSEAEFQNELTTVVWNPERTGPAPTRSKGHHADRHDALRYVWGAVTHVSGKLAGESEDKAVVREITAAAAEQEIHPWEREAEERMRMQREENYSYEDTY